jgi:outer membrane protein OmpA-like peptidoglycan-associated protein
MTMALSYTKVATRLASSLLVGGLIWSAAGLPAAAQDVTKDQILNTLAPPATRSLTAPAEPAMSDSDRTFVQSLRGRTRSLSLDESDHVAAIAKDRPKIDLEIYFDYNSAGIAAKAVPQLNQLGDALRDARLEDSVVVISGHTDAKGGDQYNQTLSERRAESVKKFLVEKAKIPAGNLTTAGYGKRELKNSNDPFAAENRRVEVVNLGTANASNH